MKKTIEYSQDDKLLNIISNRMITHEFLMCETEPLVLFPIPSGYKLLKAKKGLHETIYSIIYYADCGAETVLRLTVRPSFIGAKFVQDKKPVCIDIWETPMQAQHARVLFQAASILIDFLLTDYLIVIEDNQQLPETKYKWTSYMLDTIMGDNKQAYYCNMRSVVLTPELIDSYRALTEIFIPMGWGMTRGKTDRLFLLTTDQLA